MNCIKCELRRAKWRTAIMVGLGRDVFTVAAHLSTTYGEDYYVTKDASSFAIMRANKLPPHVPFTVYTQPYEA